MNFCVPYSLERKRIEKAGLHLLRISVPRRKRGGNLPRGKTGHCQWDFPHVRKEKRARALLLRFHHMEKGKKKGGGGRAGVPRIYRRVETGKKRRKESFLSTCKLEKRKKK